MPVAAWAGPRSCLHENSAGSHPINDRDKGYAWQAIAGVTMPVSHNIDLGVKYRYFRPDGTDLYRNAQQWCIRPRCAATRCWRR
jgi:opacity protein-like surface antigen